MILRINLRFVHGIARLVALGLIFVRTLNKSRLEPAVKAEGGLDGTAGTSSGHFEKLVWLLRSFADLAGDLTISPSFSENEPATARGKGMLTDT